MTRAIKFPLRCRMVRSSSGSDRRAVDCPRVLNEPDDLFNLLERHNRLILEFDLESNELNIEIYDSFRE